MILSSLLLGIATGFFIGAAIGYFWEDLVYWLQRAIKKVQQVIHREVYGVKVYAKKNSNGTFNEISKHYAKSGARWEEYTATREIDASEVPADIRSMSQVNREIDITERLSMELS